MIHRLFSEWSYPQQEYFTHLTEISMRSLSAIADLRIQNQQLYKNMQHIAWFAPHLASSWARHTKAHLRALADATALRFVYSDHEQFIRDAPQNEQELWVMHILEQYRVEALVPTQYQGMQTNLNILFDTWSQTVFTSDHMESEISVFFFAFLLVCRSRLSLIAINAHYEEAIEQARMTLAPALGTPLMQMSQALHSQTMFAPPAREAAAVIAGHITAQTKNRVRTQAKTTKSTAMLFLQDYQKNSQPLPVVSYDTQTSRNATDSRYRIFTKAFDREVPAHRLVRKALLADYRHTLNRAITTSGINLRVVEKWLTSLLQTPAYNGWKDNQHSGIVDGKKLAAFISTSINSSSDTRIFKRERITSVSHCAVSMLIDTSGSMKQHRGAIATIVDLLSNVLTHLDIDCEVLGFTTRTWGGGQAKKLWQQQGAQPYPGRVCDSEHIVYKNFTTSWRKAKQSLAAIMHEPLYKEGVDGEAVSWASQRLIAHTQDNERRILLIFSDGSPMETASIQLNNDDEYLCHHLAATVRQYQQSHQIHICGVGVGLSLRPLYSQHCAVSLADGVTMPLLYRIINTIKNKS